MTANQPMTLKVDEAAQLAGLGRNAIYNAINCGELRTLKVGKSRRVTPEALRDWIELRERRTAEAAA